MRKRERLERNCKNCGNLVPNNNRYCNNVCQHEYQNKKRINEWLVGSNPIRKGGTSIPQWMRNYILKESNYKCSECGWGEVNQYTQTYPLDIDHIDGDAYNNHRENLRVLCPNCHSLTKTYKFNGSRKSTRKYRR